MAFRVSRSRVYGDGQTAFVRLAPARHVFRCDSAVSMGRRPLGKGCTAKARCRSIQIDTVIAAAAVVAVVFCGGITTAALCTSYCTNAHIPPIQQPETANAPPEVPSKSTVDSPQASVGSAGFSNPRVLSRATENLLCEYRSAPSAVVGGFPSSTALVLRQAQGLSTQTAVFPVGFVRCY